MKIRDMREIDRERALAVLTTPGVMEQRGAPPTLDSEFPSAYRTGDRLDFPQVNALRTNGRVRVLVRVSNSYPLLIFDLLDPSRFLEACSPRTLANCSQSAHVCIYGNALEGFDFSKERSEEAGSLLTLFASGGKEFLGRRLSADVSYIRRPTVNDGMIRVVTRAPFVPLSSVDSGERLANLKRRWVASIGKTVDSRAAHLLSRLRKCERALTVAVHAYGTANLVQRMVNDHGVAYLDKSLADSAGLPGVASVAPHGSCGLLVKTGPLCSDPILVGSDQVASRYTGTWEIAIELDTFSVRARNVAAPLKDFQHCHQARSYEEKGNTCSTTCVGGFSSAINRALMSVNIPAVIAASVEYLRGFTPEDSRGKDNFMRLPKSDKPPTKPHEFKAWITLLSLIDGGNDDCEDEDEEESP